MPEIERDFRRARPRSRQNFVDQADERAGEVLRPQAIDRRQLAVDQSVLQRAVRHDGVHQRGHVKGILVLEEDARPVHRRWHGGRRVRESRDLFVERLDQGDAKALVLAGTEEQIRDLVKRHEL